MKNVRKIKELKQFMVTVTDAAGKVVTKRAAFSKYAAKQAKAFLAGTYPGHKVEYDVT